MRCGRCSISQGLEGLLTRSRLSTVMVVPLTTNLKRAEAIGNVLLQEAETGLTKPSVALVCQILTTDKESLTQLVGSLSRRSLQVIDAGLRLTLDLG